ncbi:hypothetical protein [Paenibacillus senegalensis]|uniref:hypothetical protein n=1 Tax=Paenibacillus senegalensis TaxID=1465766 RepID=UPI0002892B12|nr:hypothetical protein [Paenibacillus senegalensis]
MELSSSSKLTLSSLKLHEKRKHYIVEDTVSGEFYEMPFLCIEAIRLLEKGLTLQEVESQLQQLYPEEEVDMLSFARQLIELELVTAINGSALRRTSEARGPSQAQEPSPFTGFLARLLFSPLALAGYGAMMLATFALWIARPWLFPHYTDLFVSEWMVANSIMWLVLSLLIVLIHESGHFLAVRSRGVTSRLGIGHRLFLVVFETEMSGVWRLPAKQRYIPYLGGMCFDIVLLFAATAARLLWGQALPWVDHVGALVGLCVLINLGYQLLFFMKTDLYYVIENATGVYNLMESSKAWLSRYLPFAPSKDEVIFHGEEPAVRRYALFYLSGLLVSFLLFIGYLLPQTVHAVYLSLPKLAAPWQSAVFWDGAVFMLELALMLGLLGYSWYRKWRESALFRSSRMSSSE